MVTALATAAFPTFAVLVGILVNNQRLNDFGQRISDLTRSMDVRFVDTNRHIEDVKELLRGEMFRMEQVIEARLKHLEEHLLR
jgi:hypothetical protein